MMTGRSPLAGALRVAALALLFSPVTQAHHGWAWAEDEQTTLTGTVRQVTILPPHPWLEVETAEGTWRVELGNPNQTRRAGFVEGSAKPGDAVTAQGHRAREPAERRLKAVRITVGDTTYDIYPERIRQP